MWVFARAEIWWEDNVMLVRSSFLERISKEASVAQTPTTAGLETKEEICMLPQRCLCFRQIHILC